MYHHHFHYWPPPNYGPPLGPYSALAQLIYMGLANLFWIGLFGMMVWAVLRSIPSLNRRSLSAPEEEPSALERLRLRYILGQIDIDTFEVGLVEVLELEEQDRLLKRLG
jgi:hypothetical protein